MTKYYPPELKTLPIWVLWRYEERDGKPTKVPYSALYNGRAKSSDSSSWTTFERAEEYYISRFWKPFDGLGVMIDKKYRLIFIDIDHCVDEAGTFSDIARDILGALRGHYTERSVSGTGLHILCYGEIPSAFKNSSVGVEMYDSGRYATMSGNPLDIVPIREAGDELLAVWDKYRTPERKAPPAPAKRPLDAFELTETGRSDEWIIHKASAHGKFARLFSGEWEGLYSSQSEADVALCTSLAFWTDADGVTIDRIFRRSGLYRDKWEREDYRLRTIALACSVVGETLSSYIAKRREEERRAYAETFILPR